MNTHIKRVLLIIVSLLFVVSLTNAGQRGMGDNTGIAQETIKPNIITMSGKILEIKTGPCASSTGRSLEGTHFIIRTDDDSKINLHLGPSAEIQNVVKGLEVGTVLAFTAFRTDEMKENHYVAKSLDHNGIIVNLRDEDLRPIWAGSQGRGYGKGKGHGRGHGYGHGGGRHGGCCD